MLTRRDRAPRENRVAKFRPNNYHRAATELPQSSCLGITDVARQALHAPPPSSQLWRVPLPGPKPGRLLTGEWLYGSIGARSGSICSQRDPCFELPACLPSDALIHVNKPCGFHGEKALTGCPFSQRFSPARIQVQTNVDCLCVDTLSFFEQPSLVIPSPRRPGHTHWHLYRTLHHCACVRFTHTYPAQLTYILLQASATFSSAARLSPHCLELPNTYITYPPCCGW